MTKFLGIDNVIRPTAEQVTDTLMKLLKSQLNLSPLKASGSVESMEGKHSDMRIPKKPSWKVKMSVLI